MLISSTSTLSRSKSNPRAGLAFSGINPPLLYVKLGLFGVTDIGDFGVHGGLAWGALARSYLSDRSVPDPATCSSRCPSARRHRNRIPGVTRSTWASGCRGERNTCPLAESPLWRRTHPVPKCNNRDHFAHILSNSETDCTAVDSPTMMCHADVTASLVPSVVKQMQSVNPV